MQPVFKVSLMPHKLMMVLLSALALSTAAPSLAMGTTKVEQSDAAHEIKDPHYGDVLFQFYQDQYFSSLTNLMASQHFERISHHSDEAELLRGGILLSYGLLHDASEIFSHLIEKNATPKTRDRAYFYLAKISYQRGYNADAEAAIHQIGNALPERLQEERGLLQANLLMARADYASAATVLDAMNKNGMSTRYVRYNLGVALVKSGDLTRGTKILDEIGKASAENEEFRNLRDRANVALGFLALADHRAKDARTALERVRLNSMQSNKALLGFGWAADSLQDPKLALVPWLELIDRDMNDSAVLEAQIAVPYAYAELGAYGQAIDYYNQAITSFKNEDTDLSESIAAIRAGKLIDALIENNPGTDMGWSWSLHGAPSMPHANHLAPVIAQHAFQEAFKNYRDLRFLTKNLSEWQDKLSVFNDMLETRRKAFADRLPQVQQDANVQESAISKLQTRYTALAQEVSAGEAAADGLAFADVKQLKLATRIANVQTTLTKLGNDSEYDTARNRARLAAGALSWQLAQAYPERSWQAHQESQAIKDALEQAQKLTNALAQAQHDEPLRFDAFLKRIAALTPLLQSMMQRIDTLSAQQRNVVQEIAIAELHQQQLRLADYSTQARYAVAQLYDRSTDSEDNAPQSLLQNKESDHAQ